MHYHKGLICEVIIKWHWAHLPDISPCCFRLGPMTGLFWSNFFCMPLDFSRNVRQLRPTSEPRFNTAMQHPPLMYPFFRLLGVKFVSASSRNCLICNSIFGHTPGISRTNADIQGAPKPSVSSVTSNPTPDATKLINHTNVTHVTNVL